VTKTRAQADADAALIKSEAEAKANKLISDSIDKNILTNKGLDKWNGELPKVAGDTNGMFDFSSLFSEDNKK
jgi:regulator of protease activity HflC (stomatin/prohibitin superfamily)